MTRRMHLNLFIQSRGHHEASWRHPAVVAAAAHRHPLLPGPGAARRGGLFDSIFLADQLALDGDVERAGRSWLEPITVLAALATGTSRVGLIATASTTYTEPFNLARQFASIDHMSGGRAGWNIVTSWLAAAARNYGGDRPGDPRRPLRARRGVRGCRQGAVGQLGRRCRARRSRGRAVRARRSHPADQPRGRALQGRRAAQHAAQPAGPAGVRAGRIVRHRPPLRRAPCRGGVHRADGEGDGAGVLRRPEGARRGGGAGRRPGADPAGPQPADRRHRGRGAAPGARAERPHRSRGRPQAAVGPVRRPRFLAPAARQAAVARGFPRSEHGRGGAQPDRGDRRPGEAREADPAPAARLSRRRARPLHDRRHARADRRPDGETGSRTARPTASTSCRRCCRRCSTCSSTR